MAPDPTPSAGETQALLQGLLALSRGELGHRMLRTGTRDTVDTIAFLFNAMADQIQDLVESLNTEQTRLKHGVEELSEVLSRMAAADFDARVERSFDRSPLDVLAFLVNATAEELGALYAELKATNERIERQAQATVNERLAATNTLAAGVGHELRNPLGVVAGNLEFLSEQVGQLDCDPALLRAIEDSREAVDNAARIATELSLLRPSSLSRHRVVPIGVVVDRAIRMVRNVADHHATLDVSSADNPAALVDAARLGQVVVNLIHNAALAMPVDRPVAQNLITVWSGPISDTEVAITVTDNGVGMSEDVKRRIFEAFFTTRPVGEGTGLGLAICQRLIDDQSGRLDFESEEGIGSTFRVVLPRTTETTSPEEPEPEDAAPVDELLDAVAGTRVLLIDDEPLFQIVIKHMLGDGVEFTATTSGVEGLDLLRSRDFDVVLSDVMLPDLDGRAIYQALEDEGLDVVSRIAFITGGSFSEGTQAFLESVDAPVLGKPFSRSEILTTVAQLANGA